MSLFFYTTFALENVGKVEQSSKITTTRGSAAIFINAKINKKWQKNYLQQCCHRSL